MSARAVRYWLDDEKSPGDLLSIERALFGSSKKYDQWRLALRRAHRGPKTEGDNEEPVGSTSPSPPILHPEIRKFRDFKGRKDLLDSLDCTLWQHGGTAALTNAAIHGLGGVGKSVLAQEYGWRNRERYHGVWWLRAEQESTLLDDLIALGSRLMPGLEEIPERDRAAHLALDAIRDTATDKPWLLIYDNAESPAAIETLTPRERAHLIVTSRWSDWCGHAEALPVDVFPREVAADYLMAHARNPDRAAAERLAEALGWLPLALSHARATCWASNLDFDSYRERLPELIRKAPRGAAYPASVYATFDLAIEKAANLCPDAEKLMEIAAFLAPDRIPLNLITGDVMGESERDDALAALDELSLITHERFEDGAPCFSVHRLVQEVTRARLGEQADDAAVLGLKLVLVALPEGNAVGEYTEWPRIEKVLPHALSILRYAPDEGGHAEDTALLCALIGFYLQSRASYVEAEPLFKRAIAIAEKTLGPDHPTTATSLNNLAGLYYAQGKYDQAEPLYERAIAITEQALGPGHPDTGQSLNNLAGLYYAQGRYEAAEPLMRRAVAILETSLGPDHPNTKQGKANHDALKAKMAAREGGGK